MTHRRQKGSWEQGVKRKKEQVWFAKVGQGYTETLRTRVPHLPLTDKCLNPNLCTFYNDKEIILFLRIY